MNEGSLADLGLPLLLYARTALFEYTVVGRGRLTLDEPQRLVADVDMACTWRRTGGNMLHKKEIREQVESSFKPYHCGVEFLPTMQPYWEELGIRLSD